MTEPELSISKQSMAKIKSLGTVKSTIHQSSFSRMKLRKMSHGFGEVLSLRPVEGPAQHGVEFRRPPLLYLNTYQLDPTRKFHVPTVQKIMDEILDEHFEEHKYNSQLSSILSMRIASELLHRIKFIGFDRYRIISVVTVGQRIAQSYNNAIAYIWDHERDSYVNTQRQVYSAFIQVTVFAIYLD